MEPAVMGVIGAPGVGKSFLVKELGKHLHTETILEKVEEIPERIIENFKRDIRQMETILWFRNKCISNMERAIRLKEEGKMVVMDTCLISNELHITTMTSGFEREILLQQADFDRKYLPRPDVIVFLDASEEKIREFTLKRGRDFDTTERFVQRNLLIRKAHQDYYQKNKKSVLYVNRNNMDFKKIKDVKIILNQIKKYLKLKKYKITAAPKLPPDFSQR